MQQPGSDLVTLLSGFERLDHSLPGQLSVAQRLIEVLPVPVFFKARDGTYLGVNNAWEEFFGVPRGTMVGRNAAHLYAHAPSIAAHHVAMDEALWERPGRQSYEITLTMPDGRFCHCLYHKATFTDASGAVCGLIGTVVDITDRKRDELRQSIEHAVTRFLGEAQSLGDAIRGILEVFCKRLGWECGARWSLDPVDNHLRCVETWNTGDASIATFQAAGARMSFVPGQSGLLRQVLATGSSLWIADVGARQDFMRAPLALEAGLKAAFALPIIIDDRVMGALEFFSREARTRDAWLLQMAIGIGGQIGQLMARREAEAATRQSEQRFRSLTELSSDWYWEQDEELRFTMMSGGVTQSLRMPAEAFIGKYRWDFEMVGMSVEAVEAHKAVLLARQPFKDVVYGRLDASGNLRYVSVSGQPIFDAGGRFRGYRGVGRDITRRKANEEALQASHAQLERQANFDALTGLPNRHLLNDRLKQAMFLQREKRPVALVFVDLDHFKIINDSLGHNFGDEVLCRVGERLHAAVREADTVARVGGDEFVLLLNDQPRERVLGSIQRIIEKVGEPLLVAGREINITCSAGISLYPQDGPDIHTLLRNADTAMYRAKSQGRNTFEFFTAEMNEFANERYSLEQSLRRALDRNELELHYQPRVNLRSGQVVAVEALLRWRHPERGLVLPDRFIGLAEETGLIVPIGEWVLRTACAQAAQWAERGFARIIVSVNLSARQLWDRSFVGIVRDAVATTGMADYLELELTESMVMHDAETVISTLHALRSLGVRISVDDFGTGYSSLSYLRRLPLNTLKIDGSFVRDIHATGTRDDGLLAKAIISLGHSLRLNVVGEGVEKQAQREFLLANGCDEMQGFLFARPTSPADCERHLAAGHSS